MESMRKFGPTQFENCSHSMDMQLLKVVYIIVRVYKQHPATANSTLCLRLQCFVATSLSPSQSLYRRQCVRMTQTTYTSVQTVTWNNPVGRESTLSLPLSLRSIRTRYAHVLPGIHVRLSDIWCTSSVETQAVVCIDHCQRERAAGALFFLSVTGSVFSASGHWVSPVTPRRKHQ